MKKTIITLISVVCMMVFTSAALSGEKVVVPLSKPGQPCTLKANLFNGGISVTGYNGKDVVVDIELVTKKLIKEGEPIPEPPDEPDIDELEKRELETLRTTREKAKKEEEDLKGLKRIANISMDMSIHEEDNVVSINSESMRRTVNLVIQVPLNTTLKLNCYRNGDIVVEKVTGDLEAKNHQGLIQLNNIAGSAVVEAHRGYIIATFSGIDPTKPLSFSTFHGKLDVTYPAKTRATLKMKSDRGEIYTDFDIDIQSKSQTKEKRSKSGKYTVTIEKGVFGIINGGGPEIYFQTHTGNIIIRKGK